jgi:hypothetical protein
MEEHIGRPGLDKATFVRSRGVEEAVVSAALVVEIDVEVVTGRVIGSSKRCGRGKPFSSDRFGRFYPLGGEASGRRKRPPGGPICCCAV